MIPGKDERISILRHAGMAIVDNEISIHMGSGHFIHATTEQGVKKVAKWGSVSRQGAHQDEMTSAHLPYDVSASMYISLEGVSRNLSL